MDPQPDGGKYLKAGRLNAGRTRTEVGEYLYQHNFEGHYRVGGRNQLINLVEDFEDGFPWPSNYNFAQFAKLCFECIGPRGLDAISKLMQLGLAWTLECESAGFYDMMRRSFQDPQRRPTT